MTNVVSPLGADELDYAAMGCGGVLDTFIDSDLALNGGNTHTFMPLKIVPPLARRQNSNC